MYCDKGRRIFIRILFSLFSSSADSNNGVFFFSLTRLRRKPTWGTCAGLILLSESANRTKKGGQDLIGGLDVRVNRNHFGRQAESFQAALNLPFLTDGPGTDNSAFNGVFIRAPIVESIQVEKGRRDEETVIAPSRQVEDPIARQALSDSVEVLANLPGRAARVAEKGLKLNAENDAGDIVAVRQGNVFGTSFHPELTEDSRIHVWWLRQVETAMAKSKIS